MCTVPIDLRTRDVVLRGIPARALHLKLWITRLKHSGHGDTVLLSRFSQKNVRPSGRKRSESG